MSQDLLTPADLAEYLHVSLRTVHRWRADRIGPPACKAVKRILYRKTDVDAWLAEQTMEMPREGRR